MCISTDKYVFACGRPGTYSLGGDPLNHPVLLENDTLMDFDIVVASPLLSLEKLGLGMKNAANDEYNRFKCGTHPKAIFLI
ncbi:Type I restriction-modification system, M subunit [Rickettsia canadensis str. McKiel]|uniref:Type I restriction-modification system, M subunit n=1 Tax=Rickettsia canadensis (strain McKiel) TaxID=293613 RepID=A8EYB6_RICCK|nr:hypothetical protein [Rickettsia canadensis]ABV73349.1 Type I restriction-modification system, M subunit [Rickettsia canadensis str. McKiel]